MFCTRCGRNLGEDEQYCPECGKKQFDSPGEERPYEYRYHVFVAAFAAAFAIVLILNILGGGIFTFLFLPFIFFGRKGGKLQYIMSGVCWGFISGATTSIVLRMIGMY